MLNGKVEIIKGRLYGFEKNPKYSNHFCHYSIHLRICDEKHNQRRYADCWVGENELDTSMISLIKDNIDTILSDVNNTKPLLGYEDCYGKDSYHYTGVPVKLVIFNGKVIALSNAEETLFKLLDNFLTAPIKKEKLEEIIKDSINKEMIERIQDYTSLIYSINEFIMANNDIHKTYKDEFNRLDTAVEELHTSIEDMKIW